MFDNIDELTNSVEEDEEVFFDYVDENGTIKKAEVLTLFSLEGSDKQYAMCSLPADDGNFDITAFIVNTLPDNTVSLDDIESEEELSCKCNYGVSMTQSINEIRDLLNQLEEADKNNDDKLYKDTLNKISNSTKSLEKRKKSSKKVIF